jgi:hypothetical protein
MYQAQKTKKEEKIKLSSITLLPSCRQNDIRTIVQHFSFFFHAHNYKKLSSIFLFF